MVVQRGLVGNRVSTMMHTGLPAKRAKLFCLVARESTEPLSPGSAEMNECALRRKSIIELENSST
jgi:hypothetical protein